MRIFAVALFLMLSTQVVGQFTEVSCRQGFSNDFTEFVRGSNGEFLIGSYRDNGSIATIYSVSSDSVIWEGYYYNIIFDAFRNPQGNIVMITTSMGCDSYSPEPSYRYEIASNGEVITSGQIPHTIYGVWDYDTKAYPFHIYTFWHTILKLDNEGVIIYETETIENVDGFNEVIEGFDGELLAFSENSFMAVFGESGNLVDTVQLPEEINHAERLPYGDIFLFSDSVVYKLDTTFSVQDITAPLGLTDNIMDFAVDSSGIFILSENGRVYHIDTSYAIAAQVNLSSIMEVNRIWPTDSGLYCTGVNGNTSVIVKLSTDLTVLSDVSIDWMTVNDLQLFNGEIRVVGTEDHFPHQYNNPSALLKNFDIQLNTGNWENDVAMVEVIVDSFQVWSNSGGTVYGSVRIKNVGEEIIDSVELSYHFSPIQSAICTWREVHWSFSALGLLPQQDTIFRSIIDIPWSIFGAQGPTNFTLCAYAYNPNNKMDIDHSNNKVCSIFNVNVSVDEMEAVGFNIYPNPVGDVLTIEMNDQIETTKLTVIDMIGRTIPVEFTRTENRIIIDTQKWYSGVYLITIYNGQSRFTKKVIKQ